MNVRRLVFVAGWIAAACSSAASTNDWPAHLKAWRAQQRIPGCSVALLRDGRIETFTIGTRDLSRHESVTPTTQFAVGSVTKQFTCAAILALADDGRLSPSDTVAKWYPELASANEIRLLDLMNNVSGYPDYYPLDFVDARMRQRISADALIRRYCSGPLDFPPGTDWSYSNTGFILLARVVERVSGKPLHEFLQERFFAPLGMTRTRLDSGAPSGNRAIGYTSVFDGEPYRAEREAADWLGGAGALWSTPTDLVRWIQGVFEGRVLSPESTKLLTRPRPMKQDDRDVVARYACGLGVRWENGTVIIAHGGAVAGFLAYSVWAPATRSAAAVVMNLDSADYSPVSAALRAELLPANPPTDTNAPPAFQPPIPTISGSTPDVAARELVSQLQAGKPDRAKLGADYFDFISSRTARTAARQLAAWGAPEEIRVDGRRERGGLEVSTMTLVFVDQRKLTGLMYRRPDGLIEQLLLSRPAEPW